MAKDPAFLFYTNDFFSGTQFLTDDQLGKYIRLLMAQHQHGHLTDEQMNFICKSYDKQVYDKFKKDENNLWYNSRLKLEIDRRKSYTESRSKNREGKVKPIKPIKKKKSISYEKHMEDINKDKDVIEIDNVFYRKFAHLALTNEEFEKLIKLGYTKLQIDNILDGIENWKNNKNYSSLYLTSIKWLRKETKLEIENKVTNNIPAKAINWNA